MKKSKLVKFIKEEILKESSNSEINEMAKIAGDLKSSIERVVKANPDLENLPLKKKIKADPDVQNALAGQTLYDNQLNKFIALTKGDRTVGKRGRKADPNSQSKQRKTGGKKGRPKSAPKDPSLSTSKLGGKKYYTKKTKGDDNSEGPTNAELRKLAKSGGYFGKDKSKQLKQQTKSQLVKKFLADLKTKGIVDASNKIIDKEAYTQAWNAEKPKIQAQVNAVNENSSMSHMSPDYKQGYGDGYIDGYSDGENGNEKAIYENFKKKI